MQCFITPLQLHEVAIDINSYQVAIGINCVSIPLHETAEFTTEDLGLHALVGEGEGVEQLFPNLLGA